MPFVTAGIMAAGALASFVGQSQQASALAKQQQLHNEAVVKATIDNYKELSAAEQAIAYNMGQDTIQSQINKLNAIGQMEAMASATGARGGSVNLNFMNIEQQAERANNDLYMAREDALRQVNNQAKSIQQQGVNNMSNSPIAKPSLVKSIADGVALGGSLGNTFKTTTASINGLSRIKTNGI